MKLLNVCANKLNSQETDEMRSTHRWLQRCIDWNWLHLLHHRKHCAFRQRG